MRDQKDPMHMLYNARFLCKQICHLLDTHPPSRSPCTSAFRGHASAG